MCALTLALGCAVGAAPAGAQLIGSDPSASDLAGAMQATGQPGLVTGASWPVLPDGAVNPSSAQAVGAPGGFVGHLMPDDGSTFAVLTTGDVALADPPNDVTNAGVDNGTTSRNVNDLSVLEVDVNVPSGNNCLAVDGAFYSEEYPEYVGSQYNDAFVAELDTDSWTYDVASNTLTAPSNFAFDDGGHQLTVNSVAFGAGSDTGLQYDGSTRLLTASTPITPGPHSLFFSVYDAGDHLYDTAMFLDNLRTLTLPASECVAGAKLQDTDGDGIPDDWERNGLRDNNGAMLLNLPAMGADPNHKDVFVQLDSMHGLQLDNAALKFVYKAFGDAPVDNPDGTTGIHLHVDNGPQSVMNPTTGQQWGALSQAHTNLPFQSALGSFNGNNYNWSAFDAIKSHDLDASREAAFHYAISANRLDAKSTSSGISRGIKASDFVVALGTRCNPEGTCTGSLTGQAGTFMHELGHNLGLRHGGQVDTQFVPNYLSVMNYTFQEAGLIGSPDLVDYSRYDSSQIPTLDESNLDEGLGFGLDPANPFAKEDTLIRCPGGFLHSAYWTPVSLSGPVDFNCNGSAAGVNSNDLNNDGTQGSLTSYDDWDALVFKAGAIGGQALGALLPTETAADEPSQPELEEAANALVPPPVATTGPVTQVTSTTAALTGQLDPKGNAAHYSFQYGPSTSYGTFTPSSDGGAGSGAVPATAQLSGLTPGQLYHYQLVVQTDAHLVYGADQQFTAAANDTRPPLPLPLQLKSAKAGRRGALTFVVQAPARGVAVVRVTYRVLVKASKKKKRHLVTRTYGSGRRQGGPGLVTITVKPIANALGSLVKARKLLVTSIVSFKPGIGGDTMRLTKKLEVRFRPAPKKRN